MEITWRMKSTRQVTKQVKRKTYIQATFYDLEKIVIEKINALYGDAFND